MNRRVTLGELSTSIAHELNQPLGAIRNNVAAGEILLKADSPNLPELTEILKDIRRDDQRASDIVARVGKMLRKTAFEVREIDLNEAIRETVEMLSEEAIERGVTLTCELDDVPHVSADRVQLQQVVTNLVLNAIDAMQDRPAGRRDLVIRSRRSDGHAEVSVSDSGTGIPLDLLPHIFEPFVSSKEHGMGLGLVDFAHDHRSARRPHPRAKRARRRRSDQLHVAASRRCTRERTAPESFMSSMTMRAGANRLRVLMSAAGYEVALYESAEGFLATPIVDAPGCILLDVRMPGISGLQLQQRLVELAARVADRVPVRPRRYSDDRASP